jgi:hypothetical protein
MWIQQLSKFNNGGSQVHGVFLREVHNKIKHFDVKLWLYEANLHIVLCELLRMCLFQCKL